MWQMNSLIRLFLLLSIVQYGTCGMKRRRTLKIKKRSLDKNGKNDACDLIYKAGVEYNTDPNVPKFTKADFTDDKLVLFTRIDLNEKTKSFEFLFHRNDTKEYKDSEALRKFFIDHSFPPKMNWFELKECCMLNGKYDGKEIFDEVCYSMIFGFINYRYMLLIQYIELAFEEGMRGQDYVTGEVPLTPEQKEQRLRDQKAEDTGVRVKRNFQDYRNLVKENERYEIAVKGGKESNRSRSEYNYPDKKYEDVIPKYLLQLKSRLKTSCSISFVIPSPCENKIRVCPFFFNSDYSIYNPNAKEEEDKNPKSRTAAIKDLPDKTDYYSYQCLGDGYFLSCAAFDNFEKMLVDNTEEALKTNSPIKVEEEIRRNSIKVYYFGSVTATSDLDFTVVSFQSSVIRNFHIQRIIIDNYNNHFQNDMTLLANGETDKCMTTGDCLDTNAYSTGFIESKFKDGEITGVDEIDDVFRNQQDNSQLKNFNEVSFAASSALGMMSLVLFWKEMAHLGLTNTLELTYGVSFQQGILQEFEILKTNPDFFVPFIDEYMDLIGVPPNEKKLLGKNYQLKAAKQLYESLQEFYIDVSENIVEIRKIAHDIDTSVGIEHDTNKFDKSVKLNSAYTLLILDAIEKITHIQPIESSVLEDYKQFILTKGTALMYANEAYYNLGGIKYQTKGKSTLLCTNSLEATYMIMGFDILHFFELYPATHDTKSEEYIQFNHGDGLMKLAKYFDRVIENMNCECKILGNDKTSRIFAKDFEDSGFIFDKALDNEIGEGYNGIPSADEDSDDNVTPSSIDYAKSQSVDERRKKGFNSQIKNMRILTLFATMAMRLKKKYGREPRILYPKIIQLESNVLKFFEGYKVMHREISIGAIVKTVNFIMISMTFSFYISQKVWDFYSVEILKFAQRNVGGGLLNIVPGGPNPNNSFDEEIPEGPELSVKDTLGLGIKKGSFSSRLSDLKQNTINKVAKRVIKLRAKKLRKH